MPPLATMGVSDDLSAEIGADGLKHIVMVDAVKLQIVFVDDDSDTRRRFAKGVVHIDHKWNRLKRFADFFGDRPPRFTIRTVDLREQRRQTPVGQVAVPRPLRRCLLASLVLQSVGGSPERWHGFVRSRSPL